jgi:hypothetical protein
LNKKTILIIAGIVLVICCVATVVLLVAFKGPLTNLISPSPVPTVTITALPIVTKTSDISGQWSGSYVVTAPKACAGTRGTWNATLLEQNGALSGTYSSDVGLGGNVNGTISGSDVNWNVGGGGGVTFTGNIQVNTIGGNFTGPICTGSTHTSGTFTGDKQ